MDGCKPIPHPPSVVFSVPRLSCSASAGSRAGMARLLGSVQNTQEGITCPVHPNPAHQGRTTLMGQEGSLVLAQKAGSTLAVNPVRAAATKLRCVGVGTLAHRNNVGLAIHGHGCHSGKANPTAPAQTKSRGVGLCLSHCGKKLGGEILVSHLIMSFVRES